MLISIFIGVFVFVTVYVGGSRAMAILEAHKKREAMKRRLRALSSAKVETGYTGPRFNVHGNEVE